jgi:hypothetical protein
VGVDISATIRSIGQSDMTALGINPNRSCGGLQPDYWAWLQRRTVPLGRERADAMTGKPPKLLKAHRVMKDRTRESRLVAAANAKVSRQANHEAWLAEVTAREGLVTAREAAILVGKSFESLRHALRRERLPYVMMKSPAQSGPQRMVRLADVTAWAENRP